MIEYIKFYDIKNERGYIYLFTRVPKIKLKFKFYNRLLTKKNTDFFIVIEKWRTLNIYLSQKHYSTARNFIKSLFFIIYPPPILNSTSPF